MAGRPGPAAVGAGWAVFVIANTQRIDVVPFFNDLRPYYHTDYAGVGALLSAYLLGYLLAQVPMGLAADNLPTRRVTLAGLALIAATSGVFALVGQYWLAMLLRFLMGVSGAALYSSTVKLLLGIAPSRGAAMGVLQSGAGMGMIVGLFGLPLLAQAAGLRPAFLAVAAASVAVFGYGAACLPGGTVSRAAGGTIGHQVGTIVRDRYFVYLASCTFLGLFSAYGITAWLPTYLRNEYRFTSAAAGAVASLINVGLAAAAPVTGALSDRLGLRGPVIVGGFGTLALAFALLLGVHSAAAAGCAAAIAGVGLALTLPILTTMTTEIFSVARAGVAVSLNLAVGQVASTISGVLFGIVLDATGSFRLVWSIGTAVAAAGLVPAALLRARERAAPAARSADDIRG